jgi:hypothetical protein
MNFVSLSRRNLLRRIAIQNAQHSGQLPPSRFLPLCRRAARVRLLPELKRRVLKIAILTILYTPCFLNLLFVSSRVIY